MRILLLLIPLLGCTAGKDTSADDTSDTDTSDTSPSTCDNENEECGPGVSGCGGEGANMLPGSDCLSCHTGSGGRYARAPEEGGRLTVGGTLFADLDGSAGVSDATVRITDADGTTVTLTTTSKGNFSSATSLTPPLSAEVETADGVVAMGRTVETGACNSCHACDGEAGGKLYAP